VLITVICFRFFADRVDWRHRGNGPIYMQPLCFREVVMPKKPSSGSRSSEVDAERRKFLKHGGAALITGAAFSSLPALADARWAKNPGREEDSGPARVFHGLWKRPNLLILITDQERFPQHWPEGCADANLPNRKRLADHGLTFTPTFCASTMCTPSRATLFIAFQEHRSRNLRSIRQAVPEGFRRSPLRYHQGVLNH
jgi:hypothetical protein